MSEPGSSSTPRGRAGEREPSGDQRRRGTTAEPPTKVETLDLAAMCSGAIAAVLVGAQVGRLGRRTGADAAWHLTTARVNPLLVGLAVCSLALVAFLLWRRPAGP